MTASESESAVIPANYSPYRYSCQLRVNCKRYRSMCSTRIRTRYFRLGLMQIFVQCRIQTVRDAHHAVDSFRVEQQ
jgi:hypothetical protein